MSSLSRRSFVQSTAFAAALGLSARLHVPQAQAGMISEPDMGFHSYKVGEVTVTALYDGHWKKPHDPVFIKNASIEETKAALAKAGFTTEFVTIPLTVIVLTIGERHVMVDSGSGAQWQPTAGQLHANMKAAGIDPARIGTILISHFHPDHIFGLMEKGNDEPVFPNAEIIVSSAEYAWWTEPGRVDKLPQARQALGKRINKVFPHWANFTLIAGEKEIVPGIHLLNAPGHTAGHSVFLVSSGGQQLMVSNDMAYVPALLAPHPEWQGAYDQDGPLAVATRRRLIDRVIADKMLVCGAHFPFPGAGSFVKDGAAYAYLPVTA